ncbi:MAG TPA: M6 family metalloprotease domain-containing protein [Candidatus Aminicenantes bacterium]|nr:M6 family metalloprotease domain-containing protein [Candidatus Aminicenantes bacterium]HRY66229.1 M6 family metalloprotease domain-containing protein [Candidatus Aminicenantes bacterium]HRZ73143.1 M6 family metalloprotease domain-containing protein [Candidatus Aminicenantes bacterium]
MTRSFKPHVFAALAAAILVSGLLPVLALEPPTKEQIARYKLDGTLPARIARARALGNHKIPRQARERLNAKLAWLAGGRGAVAARSASGSLQAPPAAWRGMPTTGTVKILTLLISFSDYAGTTPAATFVSRLFGAGAGSPPFDSLKNFYQRSSYDQLNITGDVLGWYQTSYARSTVAETDAGRQDLIKEALNYYDAAGHDFSQYDNDGDGAIDYFCVFWAGPHQEWAEFWWGYYTWFGDSSYRLDGKRLTSYSWQWELYNYPSGSFTPSTIIHETGHALGAPDLYDYDDAVGPRGGVGGLDIMDGEGDHNCFTKFMFDWLTPTVVSSGSQTVTLRASGLYPDAALFMPGATGGIFGEYFMVQNRNRVGNDTSIFTGSDGLIVWHVDSRLNTYNTDFLYDNSYTAHKLVRLMEADGLEEIENWASSADAGDYYKAGMTFGPLTTPNSSRYDGAVTSMIVSAITGTTTPMSATITSNQAAPTAAITSPASGVTVYGSIPVAVTAGDDVAVERVELYGGATLVQTLTAAPYSFTLDTTQFSNGALTIRAIAYDQLGLTGDDSVTVTLANIFGPVNLKAARLLNRSLLLREYVNVLTWADDSRNSGVTMYRIYRSGAGLVLVAEVPKAVGNTVYRYLHRRVDPAQTYTYTVVAVGAGGREGIPGTVTATR